MHFEVSLVVRAPHDKVYSAYADFEAMPRWSRQTKAVTVSKREGNTVDLRCNYRIDLCTLKFGF